MLPAVIDYRKNGQRLYIYATYAGEGRYSIGKGERIAQVVLSRTPSVNIEVIDIYGDTGVAASGKMRLFPRPGGLILAKQCVRVPTWIKCMQIPCSYYGKSIASSKAALRGLFVVNGIIDSDYRGEVDIIVQNLSTESFCYTRHTKIAMIHILPCAHVTFEGVQTLTRHRTGGFGSTGK